jgi:hypothetical protein
VVCLRVFFKNRRARQAQFSAQRFKERRFVIAVFSQRRRLQTAAP